MMHTEIIEQLYTLVDANNGRITCYENALELLKKDETELRRFLILRIKQSHRFNHDLTAEIRAMGSPAELSISAAGKLQQGSSPQNFRFSEREQEYILEGCARCENSVRKIYRVAVFTKLPGSLAELIIEQQVSLQSAYDAVKEKIRLCA